MYDISIESYKNHLYLVLSSDSQRYVYQIPEDVARELKQVLRTSVIKTLENFLESETEDHPYPSQIPKH